jgi:ABC-2 type transport system ATP-binding protein
VDPVIDVANLICRYRRTEAVAGVTFTVEAGTVFALLGPNGAGKTTIIRALMNIIGPSAGTARVLGVDTRQLGPREFATIGYVSENQQMPGWMTLAELLAYCRPFYPTWDDALCAKLVADFELPLGVKIDRMSRGMRVKAALVSSLAFRPQLLVLDEPFSGLDPVVRDDLVYGVLERAGEERWSVLLSTHDLDEVERLVDAVAFLDGGRIVLSEPMVTLHERFRRVEVTLADLAGSAGTWATGAKIGPADREGSWIGMSVAGRVVRFTDTAYEGGSSEARLAARFPGARIDLQPVSLRQIFVALVRHTRASRETSRSDRVQEAAR